MVLYHATFRKYLPEIKEHGLGGLNCHKNWDAKTNGICFSDDIDVSASFCEAADDVPDEVFDSGIVVLAVDSSKINTFDDPNVSVDCDDLTKYLCTNDIIPFSDIKIAVENY